jgi:CheY-like chemotaxis protein
MAAGETKSGSGRAAPVLIVEDDQDLRNAMAELLQGEGYQFVLAENGLEALDVLRKLRPSLLLTDLLMPVMNGVELIRRLRSDAAWRDLPIVVMTAANDRIVGVEVASLNVPVIRKPADLPGLMQVLADYSGMRS